MTVLVIGATGKTGRPLVDALVARGVPVRAASRGAGEARPGVEPVRFDWADRGTWEPALRDADALYLVGPYAERDAAGLVGDLLAAAPRVERVVLLSVLGVERLPDAIPMAAWEDTVRDSGRRWTILRPNWFQQNFGEGFAASLRENGTLDLAAADAAVGFVDTRDIAEVAAAALTEDGHAGQTYVLTGPEALGHEQIVRILGEAAGRDLRYTPLTDEQMAAGLRAAGVEERFVTWQSGLFRLIREGGNTVVTDTVERITGRPARSLKEYAREHAALWQS